MSTSLPHDSIGHAPSANLSGFLFDDLDYRECSLWTSLEGHELFPHPNDWPYLGRSEPTREELCLLVRRWSRAKLLLELLRQRGRETSIGLVEVEIRQDDTESLFVLRIPTALIYVASELLVAVEEAFDDEQFEQAEGLLEGTFALLRQIWGWSRGERRTGDVVEPVYVKGWKANGPSFPVLHTVVRTYES